MLCKPVPGFDVFLECSAADADHLVGQQLHLCTEKGNRLLRDADIVCAREIGMQDINPQYPRFFFVRLQFGDFQRAVSQWRQLDQLQA